MIYDQDRHQYIDDSGNPVPESEILAQLSGYHAVASDELAGLFRRFKAGTLSASELSSRARSIIRDNHTIAYAIGKGGRLNMAFADWGRLGYDIRQQYTYLDRFLGELDELSIEQILARSDLYFGAMRASYFRGRSADYNIVLPAYPGDGTTQCLTNCRCSWRIVSEENRTLAYWTLGAAEHCTDCVARSTLWSPYVV